MKKVILLRSAEPIDNDGVKKEDMGLSERGYGQVRALLEKLKEFISPDDVVGMISSPSSCAMQTASKIKEAFSPHGFEVEERLAFDAVGGPDFRWLRSKVENFQKNAVFTALVIVAGPEYVQDFPICIKRWKNATHYGEGVCMYPDRAPSEDKLILI
ncbi:MAG TPA: histidine phosphatase family protein [Candidatus Paceibacterota bacterium]|nr:histidine phosphatase family protein [Candidatus Paceibacterota bacterium]